MTRWTPGGVPEGTWAATFCLAHPGGVPSPERNSECEGPTLEGLGGYGSGNPALTRQANLCCRSATGARETPGLMVLSGCPRAARKCRLVFQLLHFSVTAPAIGCFISSPLRRASRYACFSWKYHFAGRSASSMSIRCGLCFNPSDCSSIVLRSCSTNFANTNFSSSGPNGTQRKRFHAATTSMRHWLRVMGVTVVRLENQYFPARIVSQRILGRVKSMVVVMESAAAYSFSSL